MLFLKFLKSIPKIKKVINIFNTLIIFIGGKGDFPNVPLESKDESIENTFDLDSISNLIY